ncbi:MAG TPA: plastocyanin/azurin family copper-binding protein, partial [Chitinophagaceae bacterium]|nr:plastocyanin/azurin family copper-binding protein [Chitinophagaceae bacterium]
RAKQHPGLHTVRILDMVFQPASLTVKHGDTVVWVNEDMLAHDVTDAVNKAWSSGRMEPAASWQKIFTESADYFCSLHSVMKGKVIVSGESPLANR